MKLLRGLRFAWISLFIFINVGLIVVGSLPDTSAVGEKFLSLLAPYQIFFGLDQSWSMFAPNPAAVNSYIDAEIKFKDGSQEKWTIPRPSKMTGADRLFAAERFRKYFQEHLIPEENLELWFDLSRYVARQVEGRERVGKKRELFEIQFYRHFNIVESPDKIFIPHGQLSSHFQTEPVFHFRP